MAKIPMLAHYQKIIMRRWRKVLVKEFVLVNLGCRAQQMTNITSQNFVIIFQ
jgi:uncharacterized protein YcfL